MRSKTFKVLMIGLSLAFTTTVYARTFPADYDEVIRNFIDSQVNTDGNKLNDVLDDYATIKIPRGEIVLSQSKEKLVDQMQQTGKARQNCSARYQVLAKSAAIIIARVDFKYPNTTQHNYITLEKNSDKEWKITQVCKLFETPAEERPSVIAEN